jgi:hypothetical protein
MHFVSHGKKDLLEVGGLHVGADKAEHEPISEGQVVQGATDPVGLKALLIKVSFRGQDRPPATDVRF